MINIDSYLNDGANYKAQAIMCLLRHSASDVSFVTEEIERTAENDDIVKNLRFETQVGRYENCREQGYVFSLLCNYNQVVHYCVFEHRNSDEMRVICFKSRKDKYNTVISFSADDIVQCRDWIVADMKKTTLEYLQNEYIPMHLQRQAKKSSQQG